MTVRHGDIVVDREDPDPDRAVVINKPDATADEWNIPHIGGTVAQENPGYDSSARVAVVVPLEEAVKHIPDYQGKRAVPLSGLHADRHSFPRPRLDAVDSLDRPVCEYVETDEGPSDGLREARERLDAGGADVSYVAGENGNRPHLVVAKLGEVYTVFEDGTVVGDGALVDRLREVVGEVEVSP